MENATKALIIAGAILIAILLITIGIKILNSTKGTVDSSQATMDATAITTFNSQFTGFLNKNLTIAQVNSLKQKIIASNAVNKEHQISFPNIESESVAGIYTAKYTNGYITLIEKKP